MSPKSRLAVVMTAVICAALASAVAVAASGGSSTDVATQATAKFHNLAVAKRASYGLLKDKRGIACIAMDGMPAMGAMGVHYAKGSLVADGKLNIAKPEALVYTPDGGKLRLSALEYVVLQSAWDAAPCDPAHPVRPKLQLHACRQPLRTARVLLASRVALEAQPGRHVLDVEPGGALLDEALRDQEARLAGADGRKAAGCRARGRSTFADDEMPDDIRWIRSYVIEEEDGTLAPSASTRPRARRRSSSMPSVSDCPSRRSFPSPTPSWCDRIRSGSPSDRSQAAGGLCEPSGRAADGCAPHYALPMDVALAGWYRQEQRDLPWRQTHDPYAILVSEVMAQQTQVDRVVPRWRELARALAHGRGARRGLARRRDPRVAGARLQPPRAQPPSRCAADRGARLARRSDRAAGRRQVHRRRRGLLRPRPRRAACRRRTSVASRSGRATRSPRRPHRP